PEIRPLAGGVARVTGTGDVGDAEVTIEGVLGHPGPLLSGWAEGASACVWIQAGSQRAGRLSPQREGGPFPPWEGWGLAQPGGRGSPGGRAAHRARVDAGARGRRAGPWRARAGAAGGTGDGRRPAGGLPAARAPARRLRRRDPAGGPAGAGAGAAAVRRPRRD